jgi:hypothetical protein
MNQRQDKVATLTWSYKTDSQRMYKASAVIASRALLFFELVNEGVVFHRWAVATSELKESAEQALHSLYEKLCEDETLGQSPESLTEDIATLHAGVHAMEAMSEAEQTF